jgi:F420-dependent methylenetetrahydromethanopterin dehydrogenase
VKETEGLSIRRYLQLALLYSKLGKVIQPGGSCPINALPKIIVDKEVAADSAWFGNEYVKVKVMASFEIAWHVGHNITHNPCDV